MSSIYDYGLLSNNIGIFFKSVFGNFTIGSIRFSKIVLILINKIILIFLCKIIVDNTNFNADIKKFFFIFLIPFVLPLANYVDLGVSSFPPRVTIFLIFSLLIYNFLITNSFIKIKAIIAGSFSLISILWFLDVGLYLNLTILIALLFLVIVKELKKFLYLLFSILIFWTIFLLSVNENEIKEFYFQINFLLSHKKYLIGIEYLKPFSDGSTRHTRALIFLLLSGILTINLVFENNYRLGYNNKILILFLFFIYNFF